MIEVYVNKAGDLIFWNQFLKEYVYYSTRYDTTTSCTDPSKCNDKDEWTKYTPKAAVGRPKASSK